MPQRRRGLPSSARIVDVKSPSVVLRARRRRCQGCAHRASRATLFRMPAQRVLIVDDDPWILRMVSTLLEKRGYAISTASDGEEGLMRADQLRPDLIITD